MIVTLDTLTLQRFSLWLRCECDLKPNTILQNEKRIRYVAEYLHDSPFTFESCRSYIVYLKEQKKEPSTIAIAKYVIKSFCRFVHSEYPEFEDFSDRLPINKIKEKPVDVLSSQEVALIINCRRNYRYKGLQRFWDTLLSLLARTGRRVTEIATLQVKDIDSSQCAILLRNPKNSVPQWIPIPKDVMDRLEVLRSGKLPDDYLFNNQFTGSHVSTVAIRNELQLRAKLVGIKKRVHPHLFRHSFPVELLRMNTALPQVQRLMGHRQLNSTLRYIHLVLDDLRVAANSHPLNQAELTVLEIISGLEKDIRKYSLSERGDLIFEMNHASKEFVFRIKW